MLQHALVRRGAEEPVGPLEIGFVEPDGATDVVWKAREESTKAARAAIGVVADDLALVVWCVPAEVPRANVNGTGQRVDRQAQLCRAERERTAHIGVFAYRVRIVRGVAEDIARCAGLFDDVSFTIVEGDFCEQGRWAIGGDENGRVEAAAVDPWVEVDITEVEIV